MNAGRGYALVIVLWTITLLTVLTMAYHATARIESTILAETTHRSQVQAAAEAGVWLALRALIEEPDGLPSGRAPATRSFMLEGVAVTVEVADDTGHININRAREDLLLAALLSSGLDESRARGLADAILDWRDEDDERRDHGAERGEYRAASRGYEPRNGPFTTVEELRLVLGMTEDVYRRIAPLVTVFGTHTRININAADQAVIEALPGIDTVRAEAIVAERSTDTGFSSAQLRGVNRRFLQSSGSDIFRLRARATLDPVSASVEAVVRVPRGGTEAPTILAWSHGS